MKTKIFITLGFVAFGFILLNGASTKVFAGTCDWTGATNANWSNAGNWTPGCSGVGGIPANGDSVVMSGSSNKNMNNDIVGLSLEFTNFSATGYTLNGNAITITNSFNADDSATIIANLIVGADGVVFEGHNYSNIIDVNGHSLAFDGFNQTTLNVMTGAGSVEFDDGGNNYELNNIFSGFTGDITIGTGAVVHYTAATDIGSASSVMVFNGSFKNSHVIAVHGLISGNGTIDRSNPDALTVDGDFDATFAGEITGSGEIIKDGSGTWSLTGNSGTYTGNINILAGNVIFDSTNLSSANITLDGGVFAGVGTVNNVSANSLSTFNPGVGSPATVTINNNLISNNITHVFKLAGASNYDIINVGADVDLTGSTLVLTLSFSPATGQVFNIINAGNLVGTFTGLSDGSTVSSGGTNFIVNYTSDAVTLTVAGAPVPAPDPGLSDTGAHLPIGFIIFGLIFVISGVLVFKKNYE